MEDNSMEKQNNNSSGLGLLGVVQIVFIILKLFNLINWTWVQVFIPIFIGIGLTIIALIIVFAVLFFNNRV